MKDTGQNPIRNVFTVDVEEYFQVEAFSGIIDRGDWDRFPGRAEVQTRRVLDLLRAFGVRGTFFVLGWLAERHPGLVRAIRDGGHEIASHGFDHRMISRMTPEEFRMDIRNSKKILEGITGEEVRGYRAPTFSLVEKTTWAYEVLLQEGYRYSSSVFPTWHDRYGWPDFGDHPRRVASAGSREFWEIPMTVGAVGPFRIPFGGGGYLRAYPLTLTRALFRSAARKGRHTVLYIHPWELDREHPPVRAPFLRRFRHHNGIRRMEGRLVDLLGWMKFGTVTQLLEHTRCD